MDGSRTPAERSRLLELCDAIYCVSGYIRECLLEGVVDPERRIHVMLNGAPVPEAAAGKAPVVAFTGRVIAVKGAVELVRAFAAAQLPGWRLVIAGGDPEGLLRGLARERKELGESLEWRGQVSHAQAMELLASAAVAAVPSLWNDPCPRAAIEALSHGCALVTSRRGGLPEIGGDAAVYVDPEDISGFAAALRRLGEDAALRGDLQARARARAASDLEIGAATARLDAVRGRMLGEG